MRKCCVFLLSAPVIFIIIFLVYCWFNFFPILSFVTIIANHVTFLCVFICFPFSSSCAPSGLKNKASWILRHWGNGVRRDTTFDKRNFLCCLVLLIYLNAVLGTEIWSGKWNYCCWVDFIFNTQKNTHANETRCPHDLQNTPVFVVMLVHTCTCTSFNIYVPQIIFVTVQLQCFWNLFNTIKIGYKKSNPVNSNTCTHLKENLAVFFRSWRSHPHAATWGVVSKPLVITGLNCPVIFREKQSLMHHRMMMPAAANTFCLYTPKFNSPESLSSLSAQTSPWCVVPAP